jgi:hypothetical protein
MDFLTILTAVFFANALSAMLIYGAVRLNLITDERKMDAVTACCFLFPLGLGLLGFLGVAG